MEPITKICWFDCKSKHDRCFFCSATDRSSGSRARVEPRRCGWSCRQPGRLGSRRRWRCSCWSENGPNSKRLWLGWDKDKPQASHSLSSTYLRECDGRVSLSQAESSNAEMSLLLNKLQSEDAALRDSLAKMASMNEGLVQDKTDLNSYILQVRKSQYVEMENIVPLRKSLLSCAYFNTFVRRYTQL